MNLFQGESVKVHKRCQRNASNTVRNKSNNDSWQPCTNAKPPKLTRGNVADFKWKQHCMYCADSCKPDKKHIDRSKVFSVTTLEYKEKVLKVCKERCDDSWALQVKNRVINCVDLVADEAKYEQCRNNFILKANIKKINSRNTEGTTKQ